MKKTLAFILAMAMMVSLLAFAGCGDDKKPTNEPSTQDPVTPPTTDPVTPPPADPVTPPTTDPVTPPTTDPVTPPTTDPVTPPTTDPVTPPTTDPVTPPTPADPPHNHSWDSGVVSKEATCGAEGAKLYSCACGEKKLESIAKKTEHTWDNGVIEGATKTITCTVCGEKKTEKVEGVHEHSWEPKTTKEPTCGAEGEVTLSCSCGEKVTSTIRPTGNHKWDNQGFACTVCGEIKGTVASPSDIG